MPRYMTNTVQNPLCHANAPAAPATAPAPAPSAVAVGSYLEIGGENTQWRFRVENGRLLTQKRVGQNWNTRFSFT